MRSSNLPLACERLPEVGGVWQRFERVSSFRLRARGAVQVGGQRLPARPHHICGVPTAIRERDVVMDIVVIHRQGANIRRSAIPFRSSAPSRGTDLVARRGSTNPRSAIRRRRGTATFLGPCSRRGADLGADDCEGASGVRYLRHSTPLPSISTISAEIPCFAR
jgi:hypothetical protein